MRILMALTAPVLLAQSFSGTWHGTVTSGGQEIPFRFQLDGSGTDVKGTFFNGDERFTSTSGQISGGTLNLKWEYFAAALEAKIDKDSIDGTYARAQPADAFSRRQIVAKTRRDESSFDRRTLGSRRCAEQQG